MTLEGKHTPTPEERSQRRIEGEAKRLPRKRKARVKLLKRIGIAAGLVVVLIGGGVAFDRLTSKDPSIGEGFAAGKALTQAPTEETAAAMRKKNASLRRKIREEKRRLEKQRAAGTGAGGSSPGPASFKALQRSTPGAIGVSYGPVGSSVQTTLGNWTSGVAWSSAKVPVAVAVSRANGGHETSTMRAAITASDNSAAESLWSSLGAGSSAGRKVDRVLSDAGDSTRIQTQRVRSGFTPFGQTNWSLAAQQQFAAHLPCISGSGPVLSLMGDVISSQSWGLGNVGSSPKFKGGWGPGTGGGYLVRQFGIVNLSGGKLAVAIASEPSNGQFETGIADLNKIASWINSNLRGKPSGC